MSIIALEVDPQKTFTPLCPDELPVPEGHLIVDELNAQALYADKRVVCRDAHCLAAPWLCGQHSEMLKETGLPEADVTWVAHGIVGTDGYDLLDGLPPLNAYDYCVWKGIDPYFHPYGACYHDLSERLSTGLLEWLQIQNADTIIVGGLATDYCVQTTVMQLLRHPVAWRVIVNRGACRGLNPESTAWAWQKMEEAGAIIIQQASDLQALIQA